MKPSPPPLTLVPLSGGDVLLVYPSGRALRIKPDGLVEGLGTIERLVLRLAALRDAGRGAPRRGLGKPVRFLHRTPD